MRRIVRSLRAIAAAAGACATLVSVAHAQDDPAWRAPGTFALGADKALGLPLAGSERARALALADQVIAILKRDGAIAHPVGYVVTLQRAAGTPTAWGSDHRRAVAGVPPTIAVYGARRYLASDTVDGRPTVDPLGRGSPFLVAINGIGDDESALGELVDAKSDWHGAALPLDGGPFILPGGWKQTGEYRGHPIYNGDCVIITRRNVAPIRPLTRERYLRLMILNGRADSVRAQATARAVGATPIEATQRAQAHDEADADQSFLRLVEVMRKTDPRGADSLLAFHRRLQRAADSVARADDRAGDSVMTHGMSDAIAALGRTLDSLQRLLDGLGPTERAQPVAVIIRQFHWQPSDEAVELGEWNASPLAEIDPDVYDRTLAPTVPQVVTVCVHGLQGLEDRSYDRLVAGTEHWQEEKSSNEQITRDAVRIRDLLDWDALEALVRP